MDTKDSRSLEDDCGQDGYTACHASVWIYKTIPFILLAVGTCGNVVCLVVMSRKKMRQYSTTMYLLFLAVSDLTFLWTSVLRKSLDAADVIDLWTVSNFSCMTVLWLSNTAGSFSIWLLVLLTVERTLFTMVPIFAKRTMTTKYAMVVSVTLLAIMAMLNSHFLVSRRLDTTVVDGIVSEKCVPVGESYEIFTTKIWPYLASVLFNVIPIFIIFSGNIIVLYYLKKSCKIKSHSFQTSMTNRRASFRPDKTTRVSKLLFVLSAFFLATTTPYAIFILVYRSVELDLDAKQFADAQLAYSIIRMLLFSNFTFDFILYFLSGTLFYREWTSLVAEMKAKLRACLSRGQTTRSTNLAIPSTSRRTNIATCTYMRDGATRLTPVEPWK